MEIDPNKVSGRRSSLKQKQLFPENMTYEQFTAMQKQKNIKWDSRVDDIVNETVSDHKKMRELDTHFPIVVVS